MKIISVEKIIKCNDIFESGKDVEQKIARLKYKKGGPCKKSKSEMLKEDYAGTRLPGIPLDEGRQQRLEELKKILVSNNLETNMTWQFPAKYFFNDILVYGKVFILGRKKDGKFVLIVTHGKKRIDLEDSSLKMKLCFLQGNLVIGTKKIVPSHGIIFYPDSDDIKMKFFFEEKEIIEQIRKMEKICDFYIHCAPPIQQLSDQEPDFSQLQLPC